MQFSIDDLPAPLGPMMARISPLAMSKLMSLSAFTPPNDRLMFSTDSSTSLKERARAGHRAQLAFLQRRRGRSAMRREIADLDVALDGALAAVLEGDVDLDVDAPRRRRRARRPAPCSARR